MGPPKSVKAKVLANNTAESSSEEIVQKVKSKGPPRRILEKRPRKKMGHSHWGTPQYSDSGSDSDSASSNSEEDSWTPSNRALDDSRKVKKVEKKKKRRTSHPDDWTLSNRGLDVGNPIKKKIPKKRTPSQRKEK